MVSANNLFAHCTKEIQIGILGDDLQIIPSLLIDIYRYCDNVKTYAKNCFKSI